VKYTPPGGVIRVGAQAKEQWVRVSVSDSGPGVPRHLRGAIFDKYYRLREHVHHDGVGLGLAFCRLAVEAHGGTIEVESDSSGARFSFTIPVAARDADDTAPLVDFWMQ
jgi:signal transduction histidine kinase